MEGEPRELGDAGVGQAGGLESTVRSVRALRPVCGPGGDAVVDGGAEELLEPVVGFGVEGGGIVITQQQRVSTAGAGLGHGGDAPQGRVAPANAHPVPLAPQGSRGHVAGARLKR